MSSAYSAAARGGEVFVCSVCQCESPSGDSFRPTQQGLMCPRCLKETERRSLSRYSRLILWALALGAVLSVVFYFVNPTLHYAFSNLILAALLWYVAITLYALTQAGAALITGGKVFALQIGSGPAVFEKKLGSCRFSLGKYPQGSSYVSTNPATPI